MTPDRCNAFEFEKFIKNLQDNGFSPESMLDESEVKTRFSYHSPTEQQKLIYTGIRSYAERLALFLNTYVPSSRELALALTHLEEVVMWANAAVARRSKNG